MFIDKEIITSTQINIMKREMYNPTYEYGVPQHNAWALYNYATHAFKEDSPRTWMKRHIDLHDFFNEFELPEVEFSQLALFSDAPSTVETTQEEFTIEVEQEVVVTEEPKKASFIDLLDEF